MNRLARALSAAQAGLAGQQFALIGGMAVSVRTEPRFTRDLDLAVAVPDDSAAEATVRHLSGHGFRIANVIEQDTAGRLATVRLFAPDESEDGVVVDLLFASSGIEQEVARAAEALEVFAGSIVPVARTGHLIALKVLSRDDATRPQDAMDLAALLRAASADELALAREGIELIANRGYHRGRDLPGLLAEAEAAYR